MLLYHKTTLDAFERILTDGKVRPSSKTNVRNENPNDFFSPYVFFNAVPHTQLKHFAHLGEVAICFDQSILLNKTFYTSKLHSAGDTTVSQKHKTPDGGELRRILYALYRQSLRVVTAKPRMKMWLLTIFQEVYTRIEPALNVAKIIILNMKTNKKKAELAKRISTLLPDVVVV